MSITKKAISVGVSAALLASLVAVVVAPATALASTAVTSAGVIPVGGTSTTPATFTFCENAGGNWGAGGTISVTLTDANMLPTLTFTNATGGAAAPTIPLNPGGLGGVTIVSVIGGVVTANVPKDDGVNALCFSIGNLYITASSTAAAGAINATAGGSISAGTYASTYTSAAGLVAVSQPAGFAGPLLVNVTSTCGFVNVNTSTSTPGGLVYAGDFIIGGDDTGAAGTSSNGTSSVLPVSDQETLSGLASTPVMTAGITTVTQTNVPSCSATSLASPGSVGAAVKQTVSATPNLSPGENNQLAGNTLIAESAAGVIAASTVLTFSISSPTTGVTFSTAPTATSSGGSVTTTLAAPTGLAATFVPNYPVGVTYGTVAAGNYFFEVTAKGLTSGQTTPSNAVEATVGVGGGAVVLNWAAVSGSIGGYNVYESASLAGPYTALTAPAINPVAANGVTITVPITAGGAAVPTANNASPAVLAPTGLTGLGETDVTAGPAGTWAAVPYYFEVTAQVSAGHETTPSAPVTITGVAGNWADLTWGAVSGATSYNLYESTALAGPYVLVGNFASATTGEQQNPFALTSTVQPPTINTATTTTSAGGLLFSNGTNTALCALNYGAQSCSVTIGPAVSTVPTTITLSNILLDIASSVPAGTSVNITVTGSPAVLVYVSANTVAYVGRTIASVGAQPPIWIGFNGQNSGMITLTEAGPGFFQSSGATDAFGICINTHETFTYAPWAIVASPSTGNVLLLNTSTSAGVTQIAGTLSIINGKSCATWSIYSASTAASTIDIVGSNASGPLAIGATNGPTLSVPSTLTPGTTQMDVLVGTQANVAADAVAALTTIASNATRVYKSGVTVTALSQPVIAAGATQALGGNLQLTETLNGQFLATEVICVAVLPRASNDFVQDTTFNTSNSSLQPVIATNYGTTGLLASTVGTPGCPTPVDSNSSIVGLFPVGGLNATNSFQFTISQQATNGLGQITISNINFTTAADAPNGPVQVIVFSDNTNALNQSGGVTFQQTVSNATIGMVTPEFLSAASAKGVTNSGTFSIATKATKKGSYVTIRIQSSPAMAGKDFGIYIAKNVNGVWTKFSPHTGRVANGQGVVYYYYKAGSVAYLSIRGFYAGDALHSAAWSNAVQVKFTK